jgi:beta-lactamase class A
MKTLLLLLSSIFVAAVQTRAADAFQNIVDTSVAKTISVFSEKQLKPDQIAVTLCDLTDPAKIQIASHRGDVRIYPASVVKLFYLVAAHRSLEDGKMQDTPELRRGMRDMIVDSSNDATHYVLDSVTGTTSGPELPAAEMTEWENKRNAINRYFQSLAYTNINVNQKPWCEGPYGRERVFLGEKYANRNALTTDATARLLSEIVLGRAVSASRCREMMDLLKRDPFTASTDPDDQAHGFTGLALPPGSKLWSKAGWTSDTRHDAAYIELPTGKKLILVIFTVGHANDRDILQNLAKNILGALQQI